MNISSAQRLAASILALSLLAGCATQSGPGPGPASTTGAVAAPAGDPVEAVKSRAADRWQALIERRFSDAYAYLSPGYRELTSNDQYIGAMSTRPVKWERADISEASCESEVCEVKILMTYSLTLPQPGVGRVSSISMIDERWLNIDGQWYHLPDEG